MIYRLFQTFIRGDVVHHLDCNSLVLDSQDGFRNNRSCLSKLLTIYDKSFAVCDVSKLLDVIYLAFQKAFDKVSQYILQVAS